MNRNYYACPRFLLAALTMTALSLPAAEVPLALDLTQTHDVEAHVLAGGGYEITTRGSDPYVMTMPFDQAYDPDNVYVLAFDYFCTEGLGPIQLFYGPPIRAGQSADGPPVLASEGWTSYALNIKTQQQPGSWREGYTRFRLDFGTEAGRTIQLRNIRLREPNAHEKRTETQADAAQADTATFEARMKAMIAARYANRISRVDATADTVRITISLKDPAEDFVLCEVPLYQTPAGRSEFVWQQPLSLPAGEQTLALPRLRDEHDRVFSSWMLMRQTGAGLIPASHQRFVDTMPAAWSLNRDRPRSKKGTVGLHGGDSFQFDDYQALGIHNCTKNILLSEMVSFTPEEDTFAHRFNGATIYIKRNGLARYDQAMLEMDRLQIVVSAIILISKGSPMSHPDCAPQGIYAMPNVVEPEGWGAYAAWLDFLAQRYTRPDRKFGRITHWILHNEVDAGWIWTNAGEKPMHTYLDLYYRSMRTAQGALRRYGNAGNVLISLTHYWTDRYNARCYSPKAMLDLLAERTAREGNFDWGLAYHPYPQNLRDPRTWLDTKATFSFDTPLITPKNLEVLDAYMRRPPMLFEGQPRPIVLSEQGSNSPDHSETSYRDQAAGLVYTWLKLEKLDTIESYVHHRWMDHPDEGGLHLGLRRNSKDPDPDESKKPAWEIYRKLGTPQQAEAVTWARQVIPQRYLENIPRKEVMP